MKPLIQLSILWTFATAVTMVTSKQCDSTGKHGGHCNVAKGGKKTKTSQKSAAPPHWQTEPPSEKHIDVREGANVDLSCAIKGTPEPDFYWLSGRKRIDANNTEKYDVNKGKLHINNIKMIDSGPYTCVAENRMGHLNFTFSILVLENMPLNDIDVVDQPTNQTAQAGDTVVFQCSSDDWPRPNISWTRRRYNEPYFEVMKNSDKENTLIIANVTKDDQGIYVCTIANPRTQKEFTAHLRVIHPGESLQFEPKCSIHLIREVYIDHATSCRTAEPVDLYYCMGTCGRSYYMPKIVVSNPRGKIERVDDAIARTCKCCVGKVETTKIVEMDCPLSQKRLAYIPVLNRCECQPCAIEESKVRSRPSLRNGSIKPRTRKTMRKIRATRRPHSLAQGHLVK